MIQVGLPQHGDRLSRNVGLLISTAVRYPEVGTVRYQPRSQTLQIVLLVTGSLDEPQWQESVRVLEDTLEVYHQLEQRGLEVFRVERETYAEMTAVTITRDTRTLTPEEMYTIVAFFRERFGDRLVSESTDLDGEDEMYAQFEMIQQILADLESARSDQNLIAIRDGGRVMVFQK